VDGDPAAAADVLQDPLGRLPQPAEGVQRVLVGGLQECARGPRLGHAAAHEHLGEHAGDAELRGQALGGRELVRLQGQACVVVGHRPMYGLRAGRNRCCSAVLRSLR
jgi:hypothetical protein